MTIHRYGAGGYEPMRPLPGYPDDVEGYPDDELGVAEGEPARPRFEGNRRARRRAAALKRKGVRVVVGPPVFYPVSPDTLRVARGQAEVRKA
ncbi:hypothetical protein [Methylobacterium gnaphalii]|uniref:hypothetical protein n=1 Tax=Methylobacterium gnaphalii TaxID=1010610 RepID=UPI0011BF40D9|nr:hypothetical protein [Methylobacterium gnaphalii]